MHSANRLIAVASHIMQALLSVATLAMVSACSALPFAENDLSALTPPGPPISSFQVSGRAMLRQEQRIDHFRFSWSHDDNRDTLMLTTPFGQGLAQVRSTATGATLELPDGRTEISSDFRTLANLVFGQPIPVDELAQWLRGARPQLNAQVDGWQIKVESTYLFTPVNDTELGGAHILPRTLSIRQHETLLRLVIDDNGDAQ